MGATHILPLQKALDRMNLKIHEVSSQLTGASGLRRIRAILRGEREPEKLVELCDAQVLCKKRQRMIGALRGRYTEEQLFARRQALPGGEFYPKQILGGDRRRAAVLKDLPRGLPPRPPAPNPGGVSAPDPPRLAAQKVHPNAPQIEQLRAPLTRLCGGHERQPVADVNRVFGAANRGRGGPGPEPMADAQTFHRLAGAGTRQSAEGPAAGNGQTLSRSSRPLVWRGGSEFGPEQASGAGWLLPVGASDARRAGGQHRGGAQSRRIIL